MVKAEGLTAKYDERVVLHGLDFQVDRGELVGLLGPNGSGKSTLLLCLSKVLRIHTGRVAVAGRDLSAYSARALARVEASVPQRLEISFPFKCIEVVLMGRYPHQHGLGGDSEEDLAKATEAMRVTETLEFAQRRITEISGGEAQRVIMARALAQEAELMLLDEATANLDVAHKMRMFDLFLEKNRQGATFLCAMHDLNLAALYCRRLIFLKKGRISVDGPTTETFTEANLSNIYETEVRVTSHPETGAPQAMFVPGAHRSGISRQGAASSRQ